MERKISRLKILLAEISDIQAAASVLEWDQQTYMPSGGVYRRGQQLGTLQNIAHTKFTSPGIGKLLDDLRSKVDELDPNSDDARLIKVSYREYEKRIKVPPEWITEFTEMTSVATQIWQEAREEDNFTKFQPYLEQIFDLRRQYADYFAPYDHIYDPLLDDYEPGLKTLEVQEVFKKIRPQQVELIKAIADKSQVHNEFLYLDFDDKKQWDFGVEVITKFGYDWQHGRQDKSAHPFTISFGLEDVRITTRVYPNSFNIALFGTMHESGHALYDLGIDPALVRTPLEHGASYAIHESQSRLYENLVGRSFPFWIYFYPKLQGVFHDQLRNVSIAEFYRGINRVEPSLIRVEADEATYNLHIMLRLDLEIALLEGKVEIKDLPYVWDSLMDEYLGVHPESDRNGVLQDIHWASGMIGYFSAYALGNIISVQLWEKMLLDMPDLDYQFERGEFSTLLGWLRENVHQHGAKYEPQELVKRITGSYIDPAPYLRYLQKKFGEIYGISA